MSKPSAVNEMYARHLYGVKGVNQRVSGPEMFNARLEAHLFNKLMEMCVNRFQWRGLPSTIDTRYLEMTLFQHGTVVVYDNENYGLLALKGAGQGLDHYNNATAYTVSAGVIHETIPRALCTPIHPNYSRTPDVETAILYARRIAQMDVSIDVNTLNARQPRILAADENTRLTVENLNRQIDVGTPAIKVDRSLDPTAGVTALDMGVDPKIFDMLGIARTRVWNECMSMLGLKNANQDKKERLVADEVSANDEQVAIMRAVNLNARQLAAEEISRKFGLDVTVDYDDDIAIETGEVE